MRPKLRTMAEICVLACAVVFSVPQRDQASEHYNLPVSGPEPQNELRALDRKATELLKRWDIPGASIAVMKSGNLIFSRGYGFADKKNEAPVLSNKSLFRIASVSKPVTAAAALKLIDDGKLGLEEKVFDILPLPENMKTDNRIKLITIRDLLNMSAGWDKERSGDPILPPYINRAARRFNLPSPANFDTTMRYVLTKKLDFQPGARFAYSNFTYGLLGKVIEARSKTDYETFVRENIFTPSGVQLYRGHTREEDRLPNEVVYYAPFEPRSRSFLPTKTKHVEAPYARAYMESDIPMLGWVSTAPELAQLIDRLFNDPRIISEGAKTVMRECPNLACWKGKKRYFAMGWEVSSDGANGFSFYKDGTFPGTRAFVEHTADGITWVCLFNARPPQKRQDRFAAQVRELMAHELDKLPNRHPQVVLPKRKWIDYRPIARSEAKLVTYHFSARKERGLQSPCSWP